MPRPPAPFDPKRDRPKEKNYEKVLELELPIPMPVVETGPAEEKPEIGDVTIDMFNESDLDRFII